MVYFIYEIPWIEHVRDMGLIIPKISNRAIFLGNHSRNDHKAILPEANENISFFSLWIAKNINIAISEGSIEHFRRGVRSMLLPISVPFRMRMTMSGLSMKDLLHTRI